MATNNFKPFAIGSGANVLSQADYESLGALSSGFQAGKASSAQINKALRQGAVMASILAQFIADSSGNDVLDNGNTAAILASLKSGLLSASLGRLLRPPVILLSSGTYTPGAGTKSIIVEVQGAGGGGGGVGATSASTVAVASGGSGGAYAKSYLTNLSASYAVTIGAPGSGGVNGSGGNAGSTTFGSIITCGGGFGGGSGTSAPPIIQNATGIPTASGGNIENISGQGAVIGMAISLNAIISGGGGGSPLGAGGGSHGTAAAGFAASGYGAGGGGANAYASNSTQYNGAAGSNGVVIVWEYA
ncbi:hypothetical protein [Pantoea sp. MT58]|uniref:hypothetical protein n=1 Tax=Pantoea sp. MT58 TaxID=2768165 RepID=UPI00165ACA2A|nr:hypothetical protein [Pantoea sp. MT58]QNQ59799.1 hypothetical protein IAI47_06025 [Pantoea sp. MT58]